MVDLLRGSQGKSVDDLWFPLHANFRLFGLNPQLTFACCDVIKDANIESDFERFKAHLNNDL